MIYIGIDASSRSTGYSVFDGDKLIDYGMIKSSSNNWRDNIISQSDKIIAILNKYLPDRIFMEDVPLKAANPKLLVQLGAVQGFFYGIFTSHKIPITFLIPSQWRSPVGLFDGTREGTSRAEMKRKSVEKANEVFGLNLVWKSPTSKFNEDDIADSILIAYSQIMSMPYFHKGA